MPNVARPQPGGESSLPRTSNLDPRNSCKTRVRSSVSVPSPREARGRPAVRPPSTARSFDFSRSHRNGRGLPLCRSMLASFPRHFRPRALRTFLLRERIFCDILAERPLRYLAVSQLCRTSRSHRSPARAGMKPALRNSGRTQEFTNSQATSSFARRPQNTRIVRSKVFDRLGNRRWPACPRLHRRMRPIRLRPRAKRTSQPDK